MMNDEMNQSPEEVRAELLRRITAEGEALTPRQLRRVLAYVRGLK
jgi:hypothetical protein